MLEGCDFMEEGLRVWRRRRHEAMVMIWDDLGKNEEVEPGSGASGKTEATFRPRRIDSQG